MPAERKIQILLADNHEMVRRGVKALLSGTEINVLAEASTGAAAVKLAQEKAVDLVLLDISMPDGDGLTAMGRIKLDKPELPVLLFSAFDNPASIAKAIALGASGFLLKDFGRDQFLSAIRTAAAGEYIWTEEMLRSASYSLKTARLARCLETSLNEREDEMLRQMAFGSTNQQIATTMKISYESVKIYVHQILQKLGVTDRTQAALWAVRNDLT